MQALVIMVGLLVIEIHNVLRKVAYKKDIRQLNHLNPQ